jgi:PKD repeat protein
VTAPSKVTTVPSILLTVNVTASDVDGDAITSLVAQGTQATDLPAGASFMVNASNTEGTLTWTPDPVQVGNYGIDFIATSGALELRTIWVTRIVVNPDRAPVVTAPTSAPGAEGALLTFVVTAADPDAGSPIASLTGDPLPFGATFVSNADHTSGTFSWTPDFAQAGVYPIVFTAVNALSGSATTQVQISNVNRPPVASAGGPYTGVAGVSVSFSAAGSGDPDGDPISFAWDFGDLTTGSGVAPMHVYAAGGTYDVQVTVTDTGSPALSGTAATTASILASLQARAFVSGGNKSIRLGSEKPKWCAEVEPVEGNFSLADVLPSTLFLEHAGNQIPALTGKSSAASDQDRNGIEEMEVCFSKADLRTLFAGLPSGRSTVPVRVGGTLQSGAQFSAPLEVEVYATGSSGSASVYPNPFNPEGTLSFTTSRPGPVRALLYDKSGRLVRTLANQRFAAAGYHDIRIDGRSDSGSRLASGVYFYRLDTVDGPVVGSLSIIK